MVSDPIYLISCYDPWRTKLVMTDACYWHFCFSPIGVTVGDGVRIFGFSEFLSVVALLTVVYTIADVRYKFRIAVTPGALYRSTFFLLSIIGVESLLSELWIAEGWYVPVSAEWFTYTIWQTIFGFLFLSTFLTWMYYAFIRPPIYGRSNAKRFATELYRYILRGSEDELSVIANELARSAKSLVLNSAQARVSTRQGKSKKTNDDLSGFAHDILLLIGNRKFCRKIVENSPVTAQAFFEDMVNEKRYGLPVGAFARNISSEAILQKGSFLYGEAEGYDSGLLGYLKPVSLAVYGNYRLLSSLERTHGSPFNIHFEEMWDWKPAHWKAYLHAASITLKNGLEDGDLSYASGPLREVFRNLEHPLMALHELDEMPDAYSAETFKVLQVIVRFVTDALDTLSKNSDKLPKSLKPNEHMKSIYDDLSDLIVQMCDNAASVKSPSEIAWSVQRNAIWGRFFGLSGEGEAWRIVQFKVRRALYDYVVSIEKLPNYQNARVLGFCLNVLGLRVHDRKGYGKEAYPLAKSVQSWVRKNFAKLYSDFPDVAESALIGSITYDSAKNRLVQTYGKSLGAPKGKEIYLELDVP